MFGAQQLAWLRNALIYSRAPIKLVVNGSQMWNRANRFEGWNHFATEQRAFADWLVAQRSTASCSCPATVTSPSC